MKIVILEDRGIYKEGDIVNSPYRHALQWVMSGYAEYADGREAPKPKKEEPEEEVSQYEELKVSQLDALLISRELSTDGSLADKVARLEASDVKKE